MASSSCCPPSSPFVVKFPLPSTSTCFENCLQLPPFSANRDLLSCWMPTTVWEELFSLFTLQFPEQQNVASRCCKLQHLAYVELLPWLMMKTFWHLHMTGMQTEPTFCFFFYPLNQLLWFLKVSFVGQRAAHPSCKRRRRMTKNSLIRHLTPSKTESQNHTFTNSFIAFCLSWNAYGRKQDDEDPCMLLQKRYECVPWSAWYWEFQCKICHRSCCCCWSLQWCHCFFQLE